MGIFSGSYSSQDVEFLLKPIEMEMVSIEKKERLIQSGKAHYSDLLSQESPPSQAHIALFNQAFELGKHRLAKEILTLATALCAEYANNKIVLVSLVRAGVPLGVLLHRALKDLGHESYHYAVSIIRDRGIDDKALSYIEAKHGAQQIVFVDGWTGKGAIAQQLIASLSARKNYPSIPKLVVLADPCGMAWMSASFDDWLIPFGILGATVSGLLSRSVWSDTDFHGCVIYEHLKANDSSVAFIEEIHALQKKIDTNTVKPIFHDQEKKQQLKNLSLQVVSSMMERFSVDQVNRVKTGIAEATRAVMRRVPEHVLVSDSNDKDLSLLIMLAKQNAIEVQEVGFELGQYKAVTIIKKVL